MKLKMMKGVVFAVLSVMMSCLPMQGKNRIVTENDNQGNVKRIIELNDTVINGKTVTDTLSITTYESSSPDNRRSYSSSRSEYWKYDEEWISDTVISAVKTMLVPSILFVICISVLPFIIIIIVLFFIYKNRKAKYKIIEQSIAKGNPLPPNWDGTYKVKDSRTKGFKNLFVGLGLFLFLWVLLDLSIASVGLLVAFIGLGQLAIYYTRPKGNDRREESGQTYRRRETPETQADEDSAEQSQKKTDE